MSARSFLAVATGFVLSRLGAYALGVRFDYTTVETHWQFLDARQLEASLGESIAHLHAQPPLLNLLYGALARLSPGDRGRGIAAALFIVLGLAAALGVYHLLVRLGAARLAPAITALFVLSPTAVLFESYFFYTHLVMCLLCVAAVALERHLATERWWWLATFFAAVGSVALVRSSFHLVWLALVAAGAMALLGRRRALVAALAAVPLLATTAWYAKNYTLFGELTASTWAGMNLARYVSNGYSDDEIAGLVREGRVSPIYWLSPFASVEEYAEHVPLPPPTGHAVLDAPRKANGATNYNHLVYVEVSRRYRDDSLALVASDPAILVRNQPDTWTTYFQPSGQYFRFIRRAFAHGGHHGANVEALGTVERVTNVVVWLQVLPEPSEEVLLAYHRPEMLAVKVSSLAWTSLAGSLLVVCYVPAVAWRRWREGEGGRRDAVVLSFMLFSVVWVAAVGNLLEVGENQRFKFETEALWFVLVGVALSSRATSRRARREPASRPSETEETPR